MHQQYVLGGLHADEAERARLTYGRNMINMKVDDVWMCLVNEFRGPIYVYQFAVFWLFFWGTDKDVLNRLVSPHTFKLIGTLYEELRFHTDALYLPVIFMLERIVFALLAVHWRSTLG